MLSLEWASFKCPNPLIMLDFTDRRSLTDRRQNETSSPAERCRRRAERRNHLRQYEAKPWWLQADYVEEIEPPQLEQMLSRER